MRGDKAMLGPLQLENEALEGRWFDLRGYMLIKNRDNPCRQTETATALRAYAVSVCFPAKLVISRINGKKLIFGP